jgi:hypothetical protein
MHACSICREEDEARCVYIPYLPLGLIQTWISIRDCVTHSSLVFWTYCNNTWSEKRPRSIIWLGSLPIEPRCRLSVRQCEFVTVYISTQVILKWNHAQRNGGRQNTHSAAWSLDRVTVSLGMPTTAGWRGPNVFNSCTIWPGFNQLKRSIVPHRCGPSSSCFSRKLERLKI